jgi:hypothetical protein
MTLNRDPRTATAAARPKKDSDTEKALKRATTRKTDSKSKPTLEGITRRKGAPEPASKH